jgi:PEP-CTERM motif
MKLRNLSQAAAMRKVGGSTSTPVHCDRRSTCFAALLGASLAVASAAAGATPAVLNFEDQPSIPSGVTNPHPNFASYGFQFTSVDNHFHFANTEANTADSGSTWLLVHNNFVPSLNTMTLTAASGQAFELIAADFAESWKLSRPEAVRNATHIRVIGLTMTNTTLSHLITLDHINDGPLGQADFQTETFNWTNLQKVQFFGIGGTEANWGVDEIKVDLHHVPEPGSLASVGAALLGLAALRRRRSNNA